MPRTLEPCIDDFLYRCLTGRNVFGDGTPGITGPSHTVGRHRSVGTAVTEATVRCHVLRVHEGGAVEIGMLLQRRRGSERLATAPAAPYAGSIYQLQNAAVRRGGIVRAWRSEGCREHHPSVLATPINADLSEVRIGDNVTESPRERLRNTLIAFRAVNVDKRRLPGAIAGFR